MDTLCGYYIALNDHVAINPEKANINFNLPLHVGAKSALLRCLFMPVAKKTSSACFLAPPLQLRPASGSVNRSLIVPYRSASAAAAVSG